VFAVSEEEAAHFNELGAARVVVVPNAVDCARFSDLSTPAQSSAPTILFVGTLSWLPNASAARFLASTVLPAVRRYLPDARLVIAGRDPDASVLALQQDDHVSVRANVPDIATAFRDAHVLAVPLDAGGGTRLKILEAFAAGVPVVSTQIGCEGIAAADGSHLIVAERDTFAQAIVRVLTGRELAERLAREGRGLARARYDWPVVGEHAARTVCAVASGKGELPAGAARRPIRVLELRSGLGKGGGPEKTILLGAKCADQSRVAVTVAYVRDVRDAAFDIGARAAALGVEYIDVTERHSLDLSTLSALARIVRDRGIDIVHAHDYKTDAYAMYLARTTGATALSTAHGWTGHGWRERLLYYPLDKQVLRAFPAVVAVSSDIRQELEAAGVQPSRLHTLLNGIDATQFRRDPARVPAARQAFGIASNEFVIGAVGRLETQKRFDLLIEAFASVHARHSGARLLIAGDGSLSAELHAHATRLLPAGACTLLGHCSDIAEFHHALDLLVQSSDYEGTPNAVLEAMAFRTPIVATKAGGTAEIIRDGVDGLLVACGDAGALAQRIEEAMGDAAGCHMRATEARRRVESDLSFAARQAALERIYHRLAAERCA
jgi:glycosyltransferase involved in cell wall biosynthesis